MASHDWLHPMPPLFFFLTGTRVSYVIKTSTTFWVLKQRKVFFICNSSWLITVFPCHRKAWIISLKKVPKPRISILSGPAIAHRLASHFCRIVFIRSVERLLPPFQGKRRNSSAQCLHFFQILKIWGFCLCAVRAISFDFVMHKHLLFLCGNSSSGGRPSTVLWWVVWASSQSRIKKRWEGVGVL